MTSFGMILLGVAIGRALGPSPWIANILTAILAMVFIVGGIWKRLKAIDSAQEHLIWHMDNPGKKCPHG